MDGRFLLERVPFLGGVGPIKGLFELRSRRLRLLGLFYRGYQGCGLQVYWISKQHLFGMSEQASEVKSTHFYIAKLCYVKKTN